jgi:hypothetical protein
VTRTEKKHVLTALADAVGALLLLHGVLSLALGYLAQRLTAPEWLHLLPDRLAGVLPPVCCLLVGHRLKRTQKLPRRFAGNRWNFFVRCAATLGLAVALDELIGSALRLGLPMDTAVVTAPATAAGWLIVFICDCLLAPLAETYFYRGLLQQTFRPWGERFAILAAAIPAALSRHSLAGFLPQLALAVFLGWAVLQLGSLRAGAALHVAAAFLLFVLRYGAAGKDALSALGVTLVVLACCLFFGVYGTVQLIRLKPCALERRRDPRNRQSRVELLLISPLFFAAMIALVIQTLLQSLAA